jgi:hypothetical protein
MLFFREWLCVAFVPPEQNALGLEGWHSEGWAVLFMADSCLPFRVALVCCIPTTERLAVLGVAGWVPSGSMQHFMT